MKEYQFTSEHSFVSYVFAKKFLKDKRILDTIKYHDMTMDFMLGFRKTGKYDISKFKKIFSKIDLKLNILFIKCDKCDDKDVRIPWMKEQLKIHKII